MFYEDDVPKSVDNSFSARVASNPFLIALTRISSIVGPVILGLLVYVWNQNNAQISAHFDKLEQGMAARDTVFAQQNKEQTDHFEKVMTQIFDLKGDVLALKSQQDGTRADVNRILDRGERDRR